MHSCLESVDNPLGHGPVWRCCEVRCYAHLGELLPKSCRRQPFVHRFRGTPSILALVEGMGIPHCEVALLLVDGEITGWDKHLSGGERVTLYPACSTLDLGDQGLIPWDIWSGGLILDVHLGTLTRYLRLLGIDCCYRNDFADSDLIDQALEERRLILTRDLGLLKQGRVQLGYFVRSTNPQRQVREVLSRLSMLGMIRPFSRCMLCNGKLEAVAREVVIERLPPRSGEHYQHFFRCRHCDQIYWRGTHFQRLGELVQQALQRRH